MPELVPREGKVPQVLHVHGRYLAYDALSSATGVHPSNKRWSKQLGVACSDIRAFFFEEVGVPEGVTHQEWEQALARAIYARARLYRERWPSWTLTPNALAKWWHHLSVIEPREQLSHDVEELHRRYGSR